jgi:hypothetical protein
VSITVIKSIWRRIKKPSRKTVKEIKFASHLQARRAGRKAIKKYNKSFSLLADYNGLRRYKDSLLGDDPDGLTLTQLHTLLSIGLSDPMGSDYEPEQAFGSAEDLREHLRYGGAIDDY